MSQPSRLWISDRRRSQIRSGDFALANVLLQGDSNSAGRWPDRAMQHASRALLSTCSDEAAQAADVWSSGLQGEPPGLEDLGKAHAALSGAVIFDAAGGMWTDEALARWRSLAAGLIRSLHEISPGNPHSITNNWWAVTHSAIYCLAAALRSSDCERLEGLQPLSEIEEWSWQRLQAFLGHFGNSGAYHEGLGYQEYTCSYLVPATVLREQRNRWNPVESFPGLRHMAALVLASAIEGPHLVDSTGERLGWGRQLSWNDAGLGWPDSAVTFLATRWADPQLQDALVHQWNRLGGVARPDGIPASQYGARFFLAAFLPDRLPSPGALPSSICDHKQGLWFARDGYRGKDDAVLGAYARCCHPGGHSQNDAGSFRFSALGWDWVLGGGQARPEARWQSVVTSSDEEAQARCGSVLWESGNVFGIELRRVHQSYSERYLALHPSGPVAAAILDLIDDHRTDRDWTWNLTFSPEMKCAVHAEGFTLTAPDGAEMEARFIGHKPLDIRIAHSPSTSRTFANGTTVGYISRPCIAATFARTKTLNIYAVLTIHPPGNSAAPAAEPAGGADIRWGNAVWRRPFGFAIPEDAAIGSLPGRCRFPAWQGS